MAASDVFECTSLFIQCLQCEKSLDMSSKIKVDDSGFTECSHVDCNGRYICGKPECQTLERQCHGDRWSRAFKGRHAYDPVPLGMGRKQSFDLTRNVSEVSSLYTYYTERETHLESKSREDSDSDELKDPGKVDTKDSANDKEIDLDWNDENVQKVVAKYTLAYTNLEVRHDSIVSSLLTSCCYISHVTCSACSAQEAKVSKIVTSVATGAVKSVTCVIVQGANKERKNTIAI